jgi:hypothetical protein
MNVSLASTIWLNYHPYRIRKLDDKLNSMKKGKSSQPDSPLPIQICFVNLMDFGRLICWESSAATYNSTPKIEIDDIINFLAF